MSKHQCEHESNRKCRDSTNSNINNASNFNHLTSNEGAAQYNTVQYGSRGHDMTRHDII